MVLPDPSSNGWWNGTGRLFQRQRLLVLDLEFSLSGSTHLARRTGHVGFGLAFLALPQFEVDRIMIGPRKRRTSRPPESRFSKTSRSDVFRRFDLWDEFRAIEYKGKLATILVIPTEPIPKVFRVGMTLLHLAKNTIGRRSLLRANGLLTTYTGDFKLFLAQ